MSDETRWAHIGGAVTASALFLAAMGAALIFAGKDVGDAVFRRPDVEPVASLLGGALLGFGAMNWIARQSTLGGIYGRAVVLGNHWHFVVGAIVLLKHGVVAGGSSGFWVLAGVYVLGAGLFSYLLFGRGVRIGESTHVLARRDRKPPNKALKLTAHGYVLGRPWSAAA